jgi:hypothetical protein
MSNNLPPVAEATNVELIDGASDDSYLIVSVQIPDREPTKIRIGHEHIKHLTNALPHHQTSYRTEVPVSTPAGYVIIGAEAIDLAVDSMREQVAVILDSGSELKCLLPLTIDMAERLVELGREASQLLRGFAEARTIN